MSLINFRLHRGGQVSELAVEYSDLIVIGYAGRNIAKTMEHIKELEEELGVPAPKKIPTIFQCSNMLLTQEEEIHFIGNDSCGEVEYIIVVQGDRLYIGLGSDHTDRKLESLSVPKAKQVCPKPISRDLWDYQDLADHWDQIKLVSYQTVDGEEVPYQRGGVIDILPPETILSELKTRFGSDISHSIIYSGTVPVLNGFKYGSRFRCEMIDEKLDRKLELCYNIKVISEEER